MPAAKSKWKDLAPRLFNAGILTAIDGDSLAQYCQCWARWIAAEKSMPKGPVKKFKGRTGTWEQVAPEFSVAKAMLAQMNRLARELGLTPSSRSALAIDKPAAGGLADFAKRKVSV